MNSTTLLKQLEKQEQINKIERELMLTMQRTDCEIKNIIWLIEDICNQFASKKAIDILEAIKSGAMGKYGISYKVTTQTVGYWIHTYLKEKNANVLKL